VFSLSDQAWLFYINHQWHQPSIVKGGINNVRVNKKCKTPFYANGAGQPMAYVVFGFDGAYSDLYPVGALGCNPHTHGSLRTPCPLNSA
jgi:hypothetical protein